MSKPGFIGLKDCGEQSFLLLDIHPSIAYISIHQKLNLKVKHVQSKTYR